jgi:ech hydrogenase subunit C
MNFSALHEKLNQYINKGRLKSPWVVHYDCGSCNGCDIEVLACLTPVFDVERFGIVNIGDPKHADVLLVTGTVNQRNKDVLKNLYDQMPEPKAVIAIGACACTGGVFQDCYNVVGGVDHVIPVDVYVPGCAAKLAQGIERINDVTWFELGMPEAVWDLQANEFGPLVVGMDTHGQSIYKNLKEAALHKIDEAYPA